MSDLTVADDGTLGLAEADALQRAVLERLAPLLLVEPEFEFADVITVTIGFQEPFA
jgi:hypothetical protein